MIRIFLFFFFSFSFFHFTLVRALTLICTHIATAVEDFLSSGFAFPFPRIVEALLMRAGVFTAVCQTVHGSRLRHFLDKQTQSVNRCVG